MTDKNTATKPSTPALVIAFLMMLGAWGLFLVYLRNVGTDLGDLTSQEQGVVMLGRFTICLGLGWLAYNATTWVAGLVDPAVKADS